MDLEFWDCFRREKSILVAEFLKTYLDIWGHSKDGTTLLQLFKFQCILKPLFTRKYLPERCLKINQITFKFCLSGPPYTFRFRVKFYSSEPNNLHEELTR